MESGDAGSQGGDKKSRLCLFLQKYISRTLRKGDVVYTTQQVSEGCWVSQVRLACCDGAEGQVCYSGEAVADRRAAEHAAAEQVLAAYALEIANLPPPDPSKKKQERPGRPLVAAPAAVSLTGGLTGAFAPAPPMAPPAGGRAGTEHEKSKLAEALQAHCRRALVKDDVVYTMTNYGGPFQSTVRLALLGGQEFCGEQCEDEKAAERAAAACALASQPVWAPYVGPPAPPVQAGRAPKVLNIRLEAAAPAQGKNRTLAMLPAHPSQPPPPASTPPARTLSGADFSTPGLAGYGQRQVWLIPGQPPPPATRPPKALVRAVASAATTAVQPLVAAHRRGSVTSAPPQQAAWPIAAKQAGWSAAAPQTKTAGPQPLDPKTELCQFLQSKLGRAMTRADVVYTTFEVPDTELAAEAAEASDHKLYASMVELVCLEGQQFQGPAVVGKKAAEHAAASEALAAHEAERAALAALPPKPKKPRLK